MARKDMDPSWSLTRKVAGKTVTKVIPVLAVDRTQEQIAEYHHFNETLGELVETSVLICDTLLELPADSSALDLAGAEKGGFRRPSRKRS
jgi:hypothetical protein